MHPFLAWELGKDFELQRALRFRLIPLIWEAENLVATLQAYVDLYLWEEVQAEALVRNLGAFARFLKAVSALRPAGTLNQSPLYQPILWSSDHWNPFDRTTQKRKSLAVTRSSIFGNRWDSRDSLWEISQELGYLIKCSLICGSETKVSSKRLPDRLEKKIQLRRPDPHKSPS